VSSGVNHPGQFSTRITPRIWSIFSAQQHPQGLHVAHVVIDGLIDTAFSRAQFAQRVADAGPDGMLNPEHIAQAYWWLHSQPRDAWTFELDLRPSVETW
jgi:NADP-dependent 3-hydroxy acid dehydrogenase YdfG